MKNHIFLFPAKFNANKCSGHQCCALSQIGFEATTFSILYFTPKDYFSILSNVTAFLHSLWRKCDAQKKKWTDFSPKKKHWSGRVVEGLFLSKAGPKRGCLSYLIEIRAIFHTSDVCYPIIGNQIWRTQSFWSGVR